jgi:hypothetical protein
VPGMFGVQDGQLVVGDARQHEDKLEWVSHSIHVAVGGLFGRCCVIAWGGAVRWWEFVFLIAIGLARGVRVMQGVCV